ncbi:MAG: pitrilysin family protein [Planctomycetota bacterium]|nr:pitrilysin family protein [Planctomycetota bacterium]
MRAKFVLGLVLALFLCGLPSFAQKEVVEDIKIDVKECILRNGMKILVLCRPGGGTVAAYMYFRVGSVHEPAGQSGIAHLLEHMLFKGSETIGTRNYQKEMELMKRQDEIIDRLEVLRKIRQSKDYAKPSTEDIEIKTLEEELKSINQTGQQYSIPKEYTQIYEKSGAKGLNASTSQHYTNYYCSLPSNKLELWMWLESDHFTNPVLRGFYEERDTVLEERRQRSEDNPQGLLWEEFYAMMYKAHPVRRPIIGWRSDIEGLKRREVADYFSRFYAPNNAVAVIVGDIKPDEVIKLMRRYFGNIPAGTPVPEITTIEPEQFAERRVNLQLESQPVLLIGYKGVPVGHKDDYVFDIISNILSQGRTSRLYKKLVLEKKMCLNIAVWNNALRDTGYFGIYAIPQKPFTILEVEIAIYEELERLKTEPVEEKELQKAKNNLEVSFLRGLNSNDGMARRLGYNEVLSSWHYLLEWLPNCRKVTADDILKTANKYFIPTKRTVATITTKSTK